MLMIKTYLSKSNISGIGVFAAEDIAKGTVTWIASDFFDLKISPTVVQNLSPLERKHFEELDYFWIDKSGNYVLPLDHDRFMNHSFEPNIISKDDGVDIAARDIKAHEELTIDYRTIVPRDQWEPYFSDEQAKNHSH